MIPRAVHRYPGIYFTAEENPRKRELGEHQMKAVRPLTASNGVSYPPKNVVSIAQYVREGEGRTPICFLNKGYLILAGQC